MKQKWTKMPKEISKMQPHTLLFLFLILAGALQATAQDFVYPVKHHHTLKDCSGVLKIAANNVEYKSAHGKDSRVWTYDDIRMLEVNSSTQISIITYEDQRRWMGKDKIFEFHLIDKKATAELSAFLLGRVKRPMKLTIIPENLGTPAYEIQVKHLHAITGTLGTLRIYPDKVVYLTAREGDSRIWRIQDIERFSQPDPFRFQIVSHIPKAGGPNESYDFQLMQDLPEGVYDYLWSRLHPSRYYPPIQH